ncbi:MAG TPA: S-methyl-5'-thioadenosine phosphorylase [Polyangia bacterium]|nr:S-methyl-5'-thioadenosine phosphorylase [Polyangia bacterium]
MVSGSTTGGAFGVLGGTGLYDLTGLGDVRQEQVTTPFGEPSGPVLTGTIGGQRAVFLARHGRGHRLLPSEINYRANVHALKQLGAQQVLSVSAVGSLREGIAPGDVVLVDQFVDRTHRRLSTFFGDGVVGHVSFADPVCPELASTVAAVAVEIGFEAVAARANDRTRATVPRAARRLHRAGTYVCMEGPQFSTRAESSLHRSWGADVIGMTAVTEAKLCREAELCFTAMALVTDYDCWHTEEEDVTAAAVMQVLAANVSRAQDIVRGVIPRRAAALRSCGCGRAAEHAILTSPDAVPASARERLKVLYGRYL